MIKMSIKAAGLALAAVITGGLITATPADAAGHDYRGRVATSTLAVRFGPTTASEALSTLPKGKIITVRCKVRGTSVDGNNLWYALPPNLTEWVSARYVDNVGAAPDWCGTSARYTGRATERLTKRTGPTTAAGARGTVAKGARVTIICKLPGQPVHGNIRWYHLSDGRWVSARYVANVGRAPAWCS